MAYEGYVDAVNDRVIRGWVFDDARPDEAVEIEVLAADGRVLAALRADGYREDLRGAGKGNGRHGFSYSVDRAPAAGEPLAVRVAGKRWNLQPTMAATGHPPPVQRDPRRTYLHALAFGFPRAETAFTTEAPGGAGEGRIVERLLAAYERTVADTPGKDARKPDMWRDIEEARHRDLLAILRRRDAAGLAEYLRDAHARDLTWGITQGAEMTALLRGGASHRESIRTEYVDNLVSLAEFMGILDVESPHQRGAWGENLHADPQSLAEAISAALGFPLETPPVIGSYFGLKTRGGVVTGRDLCALYAALRIRALATDYGIDAPRVCEIGGGMGGVAYYGARMGFDYTIVDLPLVSLLQGYFLLRALPDTAVQLHGEPEPAVPAVRLVPTYRFAHLEGPYDFLLNQDSFPEMNEEYSVGYLRRARTSVAHAICSINQEARAPQWAGARQTTVRELVAQAGGFRLSSRHRHWLRAGYVEEIYRRT